MSLRKITDTLNQFYGIDLHHETIRRWVLKFSKIMKDYVDREQRDNPVLGFNLHADETVIDVDGKKMWLWNVMDRESRQIIATKLAPTRTMKDAKNLFLEAKTKIQKNPYNVTTDSLNIYDRAIRKAFYSKYLEHRTTHVKNASLQDKRKNNNIIERHHGNIKERTKVMRGFGSLKTAETILDGWTAYNNIIRKHQTLGKAPVDNNLSGNRILELIEKASSM